MHPRLALESVASRPGLRFLLARRVASRRGIAPSPADLNDALVAITVRTATRADLAGFRYVGFATWPATYQPIAGAAYVVENLDEYWSEEALSPALEAGNALVAVINDEIVGVSEVADWGKDLVMWKLYVLPTHQGRGIGAHLLNAVTELARDRGRALVTEYIAANAAAGRFYRGHGFEPESEATAPLASIWMRLRTVP